MATEKRVLVNFRHWFLVQYCNFSKSDNTVVCCKFDAGNLALLAKNFLFGSSVLTNQAFFSVTMAADAFSGVVVSSLSDCGQSKPKYDEPVTLKTCYDPNGVSITVQSGSVQSASVLLRVTFRIPMIDMCSVMRLLTVMTSFDVSNVHIGFTFRKWTRPVWVSSNKNLRIF